MVTKSYTLTKVTMTLWRIDLCNCHQTRSVLYEVKEEVQVTKVQFTLTLTSHGLTHMCCNSNEVQGECSAPGKKRGGNSLYPCNDTHLLQ